MWHGGYADQPRILMLELNVVIEAEIELEAIRQNNQIRALSKQMQD